MDDKELLNRFAIAAIEGGLACYDAEPEETADRAYRIAEAMLRRSKGALKAEVAPISAPVPPRAAMTIAEFCEAAGGISKSFFHKMIKDGTAPRIMKVGRRTLITAEAAAEWRREREGRNE